MFTSHILAIAATLYFGYWFLKWASGDITNLILKLIMFGLVVWGAYGLFTNHISTLYIFAVGAYCLYFYCIWSSKGILNHLVKWVNLAFVIYALVIIFRYRLFG